MPTLIQATDLGPADVRALERLLARDNGDALPEAARTVLRELLEGARAGHNVLLVREGQLITTTQAAEIIGVPRPYLMRLIEFGRLGTTKVGRHHRLDYEEVMEYKLREDALEEVRRIGYSEGFPP